MLFLGASHAGFSNDKRHLRYAKVFSDVANKVGHVALILCVEIIANAIVPTLVPAKANNHIFTITAWNKIFDVSESRFS